MRVNETIDDWLITPAIKVNASADNCTLTFKRYLDGYVGDGGLDLEIMNESDPTSSTNHITFIGWFNATSRQTWEDVTVYLTKYVNATGDYYDKDYG